MGSLVAAFVNIDVLARRIVSPQDWIFVTSCRAAGLSGLRRGVPTRRNEEGSKEGSDFTLQVLRASPREVRPRRP